MGFGEEVDGNSSTLDRGASGRGELNDPVMFAHCRTGEDGDTPATLIEGGTGNVHPREKVFEKGVESVRRSCLDLLEEDMVETFEEVFEEVPSLGLTVGRGPRLPNTQRTNVDRNARGAGRVGSNMGNGEEPQLEVLRMWESGWGMTVKSAEQGKEAA